MARQKAFGATPETLREKVEVLAARQSALHAELQRANISDAINRQRIGGALVEALAGKARADLRTIEAGWTRYLAAVKRHSRPDRRNRIRRILELALSRLGPLGSRLIVRLAGLESPGRDLTPFDPAWYLGENPDVRRSGLDPLVHYLVFGGQEGRAPHPLFDVAFYQRQAPDIGATGLTPLAHYVRFGFSRGLSTHPLFDVKYYVAQAPELAATLEYPLQHYMRVGAARNLAPSRLFQPLFYRQQAAPEIQVSNPLLHYVQHGAASGLRPNPLFDPDWFRAVHPEIGGCEPLAYYLGHFGEHQLNPGPWFDAEAYLQRRVEPRLTRLDPLSDYLAGGAWTSPGASPELSPLAFVIVHPEAAARGLTPLEHWASLGQAG